MISRRDFVSHAGSVLAAGCVPVTLFAATDGGAAAVNLSTGLTRQKFEALLRENFYVATRSDGVIVLRLVELRDHGTAAGELPTDAFTLVFRGVSSPRLSDGLHTLEHGSAGTTLLRLEQMPGESQHAFYRAQFCLFA